MGGGNGVENREHDDIVAKQENFFQCLKIFTKQSANGTHELKTIEENTSSEAHDVLKEMRPEMIPLKDLHANLSAFQWRKHEYSEWSVQRIITEIQRGDFLFHMMDPVRVRRSPDDKKLYILAGHSRVEAFRRLSTDPTLMNDPNVQKFMELWNLDFTEIPCVVLPSYIPFPRAKRIALNSNSLWSYQTLTERAYYFYEKRKLIELGEGTWADYAADLKHYEWANAKIVDAYSYLAPNGNLISMLHSLERTDDDKDIRLSKTAYWTAIILKEFPELRYMHEVELYEYLYVDGNYGKKKESQFTNFTDFRTFIVVHIEKLKAANKFSTNELLNIKWAQRISQSMKTYNKAMAELYKTRREIEKLIRQKQRMLNDLILGKNNTPELFQKKQQLEESIAELQATEQIFAYQEKEISTLCVNVVTDEDSQHVLVQCATLRQNAILAIRKLKNKKSTYIDAANTEIELPFWDNNNAPGNKSIII